MGDLEEEEIIRHNLAGEWELDRSENYDEFLKAIGVNVVARQIATRATPVLDIDQTGDQFVVRTLTGPFTPDEVFTVGEQNVIREPDGNKVKLCARWTSGGLEVQWVPVSGSRAHAYTITRKPTLDDRLITRLQAGNVVSTRIFKKVRKK